MQNKWLKFFISTIYMKLTSDEEVDEECDADKLDSVK